MSFKKLLPFLIVFFFPHLLCAKTSDIHFRQISPEGGFTHNAIFSIEQDKLGIMWFGTNQGLIRYNSNGVEWFVHLPNDSLSLPHSKINSTCVDNQNNLWVSTANGICRFDRTTQNFKKVQYVYENNAAPKSSVSEIIEGNNNMFYVIDFNHFGILDINNGRYTRIGKDKIVSPRTLYKDNNNQYWIGTKDGAVFCYNPLKSKLRKVIKANGFKVNSLITENNHVWVGYQDAGAKLYNFKGKEINRFSFANNEDKNSGGDVRTIKKDTYGRIWFGTYQGLFMYDGKTKVRFNNDDYTGLPKNSIFEIYEDMQGGIWIGTWHGGVVYHHHSDNKFETFRHNSSNNSISNNAISSFIQASENVIFIGTEEGGLNSLDLRTGKFNLVSFTNNNISNIKSLCKDLNGGIWVGTYKNGLFYKEKNSIDYVHIKSTKEQNIDLSSTAIYSLCASDSGVWIGTFGQGLFFYDTKLKLLKKFKQHRFIHNLVRCIHVDSQSNIWVGTSDGLYKINSDSNQIENFKQHRFIKKNGITQIYCIWESKQGKIWIGSENKGVIIYNPKNNRFKKFDADGTVKDKDVYGILNDANDHIWITSSNGLIRYSESQNKIRIFSYQDGIQSNLFSPQAIFSDHKNRMYFGGSNGFTCISPDQLKINTHKPNVIINKLVTANDKNIYPQSNINNGIISLKPNENTFRLTFSADNYLLARKNKYKYRLINYYNDWIENGNNGSVLYTNLNSGEYIFEVIACNNDGIWNDKATQLRIHIKNYWYKTNSAYIAYATIIIILLIIFQRLFIERIKLKQDVETEKKQRKNEEDIHEMKIKFFTNVSHEFRTPLTLISWPLKRLLQDNKLSDEHKKELEVVDRNSNRLLNLVNQIIDFRKLDKRKGELHVSKVDIIDSIKELQKSFTYQTQLKKISFVLDCNIDTLTIYADKEKLETIIYNLLSNAYKYTPENGSIKVLVTQGAQNKSSEFTNQLSFGSLNNNDFVEIAIEDSGSGIDSEDLTKIFNRFEQGKQNNDNSQQKTKGSGIGLSICKEYTLLHAGKILVQSSTGEGTRFTITLPTTQEAQTIFFESHKEINNLSHNTPQAPALNIKEYKESKLLVVEDNVELRDLISSYLNRHFQIIEASDGSEALHMLQKHEVDLIVSDVMMPNMDGIEFCNIIKTKVETSHIPVVLLTALTSSENLISGLENGADAYITKPFDENVLLKQIENILDQRQRIWDSFSKRFISEKPAKASSLDNYFLDSVKDAIDKNIANEKYGIEPIADELKISRSQLHRKIKALSGMSTSEFVNLVRIQKAEHLIKNEKHSFNEVAFMVGFSNQSYFSQCFKKVYGVSPKEYFNKN